MQWLVVSIVLVLIVPSLACDWQPGITAISPAPSHLTLTWNEYPCGVATTSYLVNVVHRESTLFVSNTNTTTVRVLDLYPCTIYYVRICAENSICAPVQMVATTCEAPELLSVNFDTSSSSALSSILLSWKTPEFNEALDHFRVRCVFGCSRETSQWLVNSPTLLIPNIDSRRDYVFDVTSISNISVPSFSAGSICEHKLSTYYRPADTNAKTRGVVHMRVEDSTGSPPNSDSSVSSDSSATSDSSVSSDSSTTSDSFSVNSDSSSSTSESSVSSDGEVVDSSTSFDTTSTDYDSASSTGYDSSLTSTTESDASALDSGSSTQFDSTTDFETGDSGFDGSSTTGYYGYDGSSTGDDSGYEPTTSTDSVTDDLSASADSTTSGDFSTLGDTSGFEITSGDTGESTKDATSGSPDDGTTTGDDLTTTATSFDPAGNSSTMTSGTGYSDGTTGDIASDSTTTSESSSEADTTTSGEYTLTSGDTFPSNESTTTGELTSGTSGGSFPSNESTTTGDLTSGYGTTSSEEWPTTSDSSSTTEEATSTTEGSTSTTEESSTTEEPTSSTTGYDFSTSTTGVDLTSGTSGTTSENSTSAETTSTSGSSTSTPTSTSTSTSSTTKICTTSTTGKPVYTSQVRLQVGMNGDKNAIDPMAFRAILSIQLTVDQDRITRVETVSTATRSVSSSNNFSFLLKAIVLYPEPPTNQTTTAVVEAFSSNDSVVTKYFANQRLEVVVVNYTLADYTGTEDFTTSTTSTTATSLFGVHPTDNPTSQDYFLYVVIGVPSVVLVGAAVGVIVVLFWRNRNATSRKHHWDMHKMYSGISMVDYP